MQSSQGDTLYPQQVSNYGSAALLLSIPSLRWSQRHAERVSIRARLPQALEPTGGFGRSLFTSASLNQNAGKSGFVIFFPQKAPALEPD